MVTSPLGDLHEALKSLLVALPTDLARLDDEAAGLARRKNLRLQIAEAIQRLEAIAKHLDPIRHPTSWFDPTEPRSIGRLIATTLLEQPREPLGDVTRFYGSGVYAVYSRSDFPAYLPIRDTEAPIYVGKVDPANENAATPREQGDKLWNRLVKDHAKSISSATNLRLEDFDCRYLVVASNWQKTAEDYLIALFKPVWNSEMRICYGFGKHGDKHTTRSNARSPWDTLHPRRGWATIEGNAPNVLSADAIITRIGEHFAKHPPVSIG